jgi:hypothetical protein
MYLAAQDAIVARLKTFLAANPLTATVRVLTAAELARVPDARQFAPAVHVVYEGHSVGDQVALGRVQSINQNWLVVSTGKNASGQGDPSPASVDASRIAEVVLQALLGFDVLLNGSQLRLAEAPAPLYEGGYCYLPLNFRLRSTFKGTP